MPVVAPRAGLFLFWNLGYRMAKFFYRQQSSTYVSISSLVRHTGVVFTSIRENGLGEVKVKEDKSGLEKVYIAKSADGKPIEKGAEVVVIKIIEGNKLLVDRKKGVV